MNIDINLILNRIKSISSLDSETELAKFLGISTQRLANWRKRSSIDWDLLLTKCEQLDYNLLIKGVGPVSDNSDELKNILSQLSNHRVQDKEEIIEAKDQLLTTKDQLLASKEETLALLREKVAWQEKKISAGDPALDSTIPVRPVETGKRANKLR